MTNAGLILTALMIQQGLMSLAWVGLAILRMARSPSLHWALATLLVVAAVGLSSLRLSGGNPWWSYFAANTLGIAAYVAMRRGVQIFCGLPLGDREQAAFVVVFAAGAGALVAQGNLGWPIISWTSCCTAYVLLRSGLESGRALGGEFGRKAAWICAAPTLLVGTMFGLRALASPASQDQVGLSLTASSTFNASFALGLMAAALLMNMGLAALVVLRAVKQLQHLSDHDALTDTLNRRGLEAALLRERALLHRKGTQFTLLSIDVDHFKQVNDRHGHAKGDAALVAVAQALRATSRGCDLVARTGGEEFMVLLPATAHEGAALAARRLLEAVRLQAHIGAGLPEPLTVSIGLLVVADGQESLDSIMHRLDTSLYRAKAAGRDRVVGDGVGDGLPLARAA